MPTSAADRDAAPAVTATHDGVWSPARRRLSAGLVLTVTLVAFESLAIATVMPVVSDDLGGLRLYGWVFSGFFLGSLLGIVIAGQVADRSGTRLPFAAGLVLFTIGLAIGGAAGSMTVLVVGRVFQGLGAGAVPAVAYTSVGRNYPPELRPRVFAVFSSAWVIPGLAGPVAASAIEGWLGWRAVFLALVPLVALAAVMALPALTGTEAHEAAEPAGTGPGGAGDRDDGRVGRAVVLVAGVALVLLGLREDGVLAAAALTVPGLVVAGWAFVRLVPAGTATLRPGMPAAVAARGILTFAFFGTDAYVSLAVTDARDQATWVAGLVLTVSTLAWTAASWLQQGLVATRGPRWLVRWGLALVALGSGGMIVGLAAAVPVPVLVVAWAVGGFGIGLSYAPISVTVLGHAEPGQEGRASASVQLTDVLGVALGTGVAGVFVAVGEGRDWSTGTSLGLAFAVMAAVAAAGVVAAARMPRRLPA